MRKRSRFGLMSGIGTAVRKTTSMPGVKARACRTLTSRVEARAWPTLLPRATRGLPYDFADRDALRARSAHGRSLKPPGDAGKPATLLRPRRLVWPRTSAFHADNVGSNPAGDTRTLVRCEYRTRPADSRDVLLGRRPAARTRPTGSHRSTWAAPVRSDVGRDPVENVPAISSGDRGRRLRRPRRRPGPSAPWLRSR